MKWITLALLFAAFAALLTTSLALAQSDPPPTSKTVSYAEGGTAPVANLAAMDPEGDGFTWAISGGYDQAYFEIDEETGVLSFAKPPDYENPKDNGKNNGYVVEVKATDDSADNKVSKKFTVNVEVTNVAEDGEVTWTVDGKSLMQFEVGAILVASVEDGDVAGESKVPSPVTWQWYRSDSMTDMGTPISGSTTDTYTVASDDLGKYLSVEATYQVEPGTTEKAKHSSGYPVLESRTGNTAPEFSPAAVKREIDEGEKGISVGDPVTATDDGTGALNYALGGTDAAKFAIDPMTAQITTAADLDFEAAAGDPSNCAAANSCKVTVTATDSAGAPSPAAAVTITIKNVNEAPKFTQGDKKISVDENLTDLGDGDTYAADDPEGQNVNLTLRGADAALFQLDITGVLSFKAKPNFEKPRDANRDNVYEVTVRASDSTAGTTATKHADRMVMVRVTNVDEAPIIKGDTKKDYPENGTSAIPFTAEDPEKAKVSWYLAPVNSDPDGTGANNPLTAADAADAVDFTISKKTGALKFNIDADNDGSSPGSPDYENGRGSTSTPDTTQNDIYKVVVVACDAPLTDADPPACPDSANKGYHPVVVRVTDVKEAPTVTFVVGENQDGDALPQFDAGEQVFADVEDGDRTGAEKNVPSPAWRWFRSGTTAAIANETDQNYTLVAPSTENTSAPHDVGKYITVEVKYTIGSGDEETHTFRMDRPITATRIASGDNANNAAPTFSTDPITREVKEGKGMRAGTPVTATDVAKRALFYKLGTGADNARFAIDPKTGQITSAVTLNYESAANAADNCTTLNSCTVNVTAVNSDNRSSATKSVTIKITDVNDAPTFEQADVLESVLLLDENETALSKAKKGETAVGVDKVTFTALDEEQGNLTYILRGADASMFQLSSAQVLSFKAKPDFEKPGDSGKDNMYEVTVVARDVGSLIVEHKLRVEIQDVNEAPVVTDAALPVPPNQAPAFATATATRSVAENATAGTNLGAPIAATDADGDTLTYALEGTDAASFSIVSTTGQLQTKAALDYETKTSYSVMVKASDPDGLSDTIAVTINVTDVDETNPVQIYDRDRSGTISADELFEALNDHLNGNLNVEDLFTVLTDHLG